VVRSPPMEVVMELVTCGQHAHGCNTSCPFLSGTLPSNMPHGSKTNRNYLAVIPLGAPAVGCNTSVQITTNVPS